ncbi:MAG: hypothetical protein JO235_16960, partial [Chroococcidiopsidaceae cyanobacterium CP_BM_RX_35]|nr:hypothetical protein [Chroococcidiopsidaceae cyanobacterium CP_BM_RX_35]
MRLSQKQGFLVAIVGINLLTGLVKQSALAAHHHLIVKPAASVDLSHPGIHTHENRITFATGKFDLQTRDLRNLKLQAHCLLPTWTLEHGSIENWATSVTNPHKVTVAVPSQFADFVTTAKNLAPNNFNQYYSKNPYFLELNWDN